MRTLVKFVAVENKDEIVNREYVCAIVDKLCENDLINGFYANATGSGTSSISDQILELNADRTFLINYLHNRGDECEKWRVVFEFGTYKSSKQLQIEIASTDMYEIRIEDNYLEKVKQAINYAVKRDWKNVIWLFDKDSEALSINLYPKVYRTENNLRQLINEVMSKEYGTSWWDTMVPRAIKDKHVSRIKGYKSFVSAFANIDEKLMSIDVSDLLSIITMETAKWKPVFSDRISEALTGVAPLPDDAIIAELRKQMNVEKKMWDEHFSKYLSGNFLNDFGFFSNYRNHVAHNKLIDRDAHNKMAVLIEKINQEIEEAIKKVEAELVSEEVKEENAWAEKEELEHLAEREREIKSDEAGVEIRTKEEIIEVFDSALIDFVSEIKSCFMFREDIELSYFGYFEDEPQSGLLFSVYSKITKETVEFSYVADICEDEGATSTVEIYTDDFSTNLEYINGEVEFDETQSLYAPITQDELPDGLTIVSEVEDYINERFPDLKKEIESNMYRIVKDGGDSPIADGVLCSECGEEWVCIDEDYAPYGTCINCGNENEIVSCIRCGTLMNINDANHISDDDDIYMCDYCKEKHDKE